MKAEREMPQPGRLMAAALVLLLSLHGGCRKDTAGPSTSSTAGAKAGAYSVKSVTAERSGDHLHLTIILQRGAGTRQSPGANDPLIELWTGNGKPVPPFIAPGLDPSVLSKDRPDEAETHWWVAADDLSGTLELNISGTRLPVKDAAAFDVTTLADQSVTPLTFPQWKVPSGR